MLYIINNSFFYYDEPIYLIRDYYYSIVHLIIKIMEKFDLNINIVLCNNYNFNNNNKTIKIDINYEHTLVKKGGRDIPLGTPFGEINDINLDEKYLVRICNYDQLSLSDIIIDYTNPNIHNVKSSPLYKSFSEKHIYISPCIYDTYFIKENRNITTLTTFINTSEPRRNALLHKMNHAHTNIHDCFDKNKLQDILKNTKILINIHQTPHHNSFEELRVLPALECGVIVISEKSPLSETVPYHNSIIWVNYDDIVDIVNKVIQNYDYIHDKIFSIENRNIIDSLSDHNYNILEKIIKNKQN